MLNLVRSRTRTSVLRWLRYFVLTYTRVQ
eukprot:SAG31_NODE_12238_length_956_cov_1.751459_1_plen_28_part_01